MELRASIPIWWLMVTILLQAPGARALTVAEALGTPGRVWSSSAGVTAVADPVLSHDGAGVVSIPTGEAFGGAIWTTIGAPSVVRFWHRGGGLGAPVTMVAGRRVIMSTDWREVRQVVMPGEYRILNDGMPYYLAGPLYIDEFSVTPLPAVPFAEALDLPGLSAMAASEEAAGVADPATAPDGEDAVYFGEEGISHLVVNATGPAVMVYRYAPSPAGTSSAPLKALGLKGFPQWMDDSKGYVGVPTGNAQVVLSVAHNSFPPGSAPFRVDQLQVLPLIGAADALDAPGLAFALTNGPGAVDLRSVPCPVAPAGAEGGDAVLMEHIGFASGAIETTLMGPGTLSFRSLGVLVLSLDGTSTTPTSGTAAWKSHQLFLAAGNHTVNWRVMDYKSAWLDAVRFEAGPGGPAADLLDAPGGDIAFTATAVIAGVTDASGTGQGLNVSWLGTPPADAAMMVQMVGPCVFSLAAKQDATTGAYQNFSVDGGPSCGWPGGFGDGWPQTAFVIPSAGPHTVRIARNGSFDRLGIAPFEEVTVAEGVDAPDLIFRTSADTPWRGVRTPPGMNRQGNDAACGGEHSSDADPWMETDVGGPSLLSFRMELGAKTASAGDEQQSVSLDGVTVPAPPPTGILRDRLLAIPAGAHTVRWTQRGSRALSASGSVLWLDTVSIQAATEVSLNDALETGGRTWTTGGTPSVAALATGAAPDGTDAVYFPSTAAWIETTISLPCQIEASGTGFDMKTGSGATYTQTVSPTVWQIDGTGATTLRISRAPAGGSGVLDQLHLFEYTQTGTVDEVMRVPGTLWQTGGPKAWTFLRDHATGALRMQIKGLPSGASMWLEAVVPTPSRIHPVIISTPSFPPEVTLPDDSGRILSLPAFLSFPGPQRVRVRFGSPSLVVPALFTVTSAGWRPGLPAGLQSGAPMLTWTTGGHAPWIDSNEGVIGSVSGPVGVGEVSWIETETSLPVDSIVSWKTGRTNLAGLGGITDVLIDGLPLARAGDTWLHLPVGTHSIRWNAQGSAKPGEAIASGILSDLRITPKPSGSVQEILSAPGLVFEQKGVRGTAAGFPLRDWPDGSLWFPSTDSANGRTALRTIGADDADTNPLRLVRPSPGTVQSLLRADQLGIVSRNSAEFPLTALPFPWTPWPQIPVHTVSHPWFLKATPGLADFWVDDVAFVPAQQVPVGEALEQPGLVWTSGSSRPWLIAGWAGATTVSDSLICHGLGPQETAWVEAPIAGPARILWKRTDALRLEVFVDGFRAARFVGRPTRPSTSPVQDQLQIGDGSHVVRWELSRESIGGNSVASLDAMTITPADPTPDIAALVDQPGLQWSLTPATSKASTNTTHDGQDALEIVPVVIAPPSTQFEYTLATEVTGPGLFRCWFRGAAASMTTASDETPILTATAAFEVWKEFVTPVPEGRCRFTLTGTGPAWLDEVSWSPLPPLSLAAALGAPDGTTVTSAPRAVVGAAAWGAFAADGQDSIMILPGLSHHVKVHAPAGSTLSFRARSLDLDSIVVVGASEQRTTVKPTGWTEVQFPVTLFPDTEGVVIRGSSASRPILLDSLLIIPPGATPYEAWSISTGLTGHPLSAPAQDANGDGLSNLLAFAFGLPPLGGAYRSGSTVGLPVVHLTPRPGQPAAIGIEFHTVPGVRYVIETATDPSGPATPQNPGGWAAVFNFSPTTAGNRYWESPAGIGANSLLFVRVRVSLA